MVLVAPSLFPALNKCCFLASSASFSSGVNGSILSLKVSNICTVFSVTPILLNLSTLSISFLTKLLYNLAKLKHVLRYPFGSSSGSFACSYFSGPSFNTFDTSSFKVLNNPQLRTSWPLYGLSLVKVLIQFKAEFKYWWSFLNLGISLFIDLSKWRFSTLGFNWSFVYKLDPISNTFDINGAFLSLNFIHLSRIWNVESRTSGGISSFGVFLI